MNRFNITSKHYPSVLRRMGCRWFESVHFSCAGPMMRHSLHHVPWSTRDITKLLWSLTAQNVSLKYGKKAFISTFASSKPFISFSSIQQIQTALNCLHAAVTFMPPWPHKQISLVCWSARHEACYSITLIVLHPSKQLSHSVRCQTSPLPSLSRRQSFDRCIWWSPHCWTL